MPKTLPRLIALSLIPGLTGYPAPVTCKEASRLRAVHCSYDDQALSAPVSSAVFMGPPRNHAHENMHKLETPSDPHAKSRMAELGGQIFAILSDAAATTQVIAREMLSEFCRLALADAEFLNLVRLRGNVDHKILAECIAVIGKGVASPWSPQALQTQKELVLLMAELAREHLKPAIAPVLDSRVEGEFNYLDILRAFMQYIGDHPQQMDEWIRRGFGNSLSPSVWDFFGPERGYEGLIYYVFKGVIWTLNGTQRRGALALGAARTPETIEATAEDFANRAYLYTVDSRFVPKPISGEIITSPVGRTPPLFLTEWLEGYHGVLALQVKGTPRLVLRLPEGTVPLTHEQYLSLSGGIGHLFAVYAINSRHASIGRLEFKRSDIVMSISPGALVPAKLTACPILLDQASQEDAIRENFKTALLADLEVTYKNPSGEEKTGRALLSDPMALMEGFYAGLFEKWIEGTPPNPAERRFFIHRKFREMLAQVIGELEAGLSEMDDYRRHELTARVLPRLKVYSILLAVSPAMPAAGRTSFKNPSMNRLAGLVIGGFLAWAGISAAQTASPADLSKGLTSAQELAQPQPPSTLDAYLERLKMAAEQLRPVRQHHSRGNPGPTRPDRVQIDLEGKKLVKPLRDYTAAEVLREEIKRIITGLLLYKPDPDYLKKWAKQHGFNFIKGLISEAWKEMKRSKPPARAGLHLQTLPARLSAAVYRSS